MKRFILLFLVPFPFLLVAQIPEIVLTVPANQALAVDADAIIQIELNEAIDLATADYSNFKIFGRWSGPMAFAFSFSSNAQTVELIPEDHFFAGEWVTVSIATGLKSEAGANLENGYTFGFWIGTSIGTLNQIFVEEIALRAPGEGLIQTYGAYAGDLNNDGYSDLTVVNETSDDLRILLNDGNGGYGDWTLFNMGDSQPSPNEGADFNSDGEIDLVVTTAHGDEVRVLLGNGDGTFDNMEIYQSGENARGVGVIDLDGDGNDDLAVTNRMSNDMTLLMNDGTGLFDETTLDLDNNGNGETSIAITDANNDGIADAFIAYYSSSELALYLGDGTGGLMLSDKISVSGRPWMIAAGDLNGDGYADVASANSEGNVMVVSFGDGQGGLGQAVNNTAPGATFPLAIDLGDLDGDGDLDIVTSNYSSANFVVFENNGSGSFSMAASLAAPNLASCAILHDRDNDGDLDITGTDEGDDVLLIYENDLLENVNNLSKAIGLKAWPNPFTNRLNVEYQLDKKTRVNVEVYNLLGDKLITLGEGEQTAGFHQLTWKAEDFPVGIYVVKMTITEAAYSWKVLKLK